MTLKLISILNILDGSKVGYIFLPPSGQKKEGQSFS